MKPLEPLQASSRIPALGEVLSGLIVGGQQGAVDEVVAVALGDGLTQLARPAAADPAATGAGLSRLQQVDDRLARRHIVRVERLARLRVTGDHQQLEARRIGAGLGVDGSVGTGLDCHRSLLPSNEFGPMRGKSTHRAKSNGLLLPVTAHCAPG